MTTGRADARRIHVLFLLLFAIAVSLLFVRMIQDFVLAVLLAAIFAGLSYPFYTRVVRWVGGRKTLAASITVVVLLLCIVVPTLIFVGLVAHEAVSVGEAAVPWAKDHLANAGSLDRLLEKIPFAERLSLDRNQIAEKSGAVVQKLAQVAADGLANASAMTARFFLLLFVFLYAKFHFLLDGPTALERVLRCVPLTAEEKRRTLTTLTSVTRATLMGAAVIGVIQGTLAGASFAVAGIHGTLLWTAIMMVMSIVPGVGTAIVWVPAVIYLAVEGRFAAAIGVGLWCALVVGSVDNLLRPRLVGGKTQLPNLLVLLGTLGGLFFFGPVGIILGPVVAALLVTSWEQYASAAGEGSPTAPRPESRPDPSHA